MPLLLKSQVNECWKVLGLDLVGSLTETENHNLHILTITDLFSKFVLVAALPSKSGVEVAKAISGMFYTFGPATKIITDRGSEFSNEV